MIRISNIIIRFNYRYFAAYESIVKYTNIWTFFILSIRESISLQFTTQYAQRTHFRVLCQILTVILELLNVVIILLAVLMSFSLKISIPYYCNKATLAAKSVTPNIHFLALSICELGSKCFRWIWVFKFNSLWLQIFNHRERIFLNTCLIAHYLITLINICLENE